MTETIFAQNELLALPARIAVGAVLATAAASGLAWRRGGLLSRSGAVAAAICGTLAVAAGWEWAALLLLYFAAAALLSHAAGDYKAELMGGVVSKGGPRDWMQVMANGGVYVVAAALSEVISVVIPAPYLAWGAIGALAAASADTWATEIGVPLGGEPRSIIYRTIVRKGESGGVTAAGLLGSAAGAAWVALVALLLGFSNGLAISVVVAGFLGSITDSVLGATIQERRWCSRCAEPTERAVHLCGSATHRVGGIIHVTNDVVNLLSTFAGFLLAIIAYCIVGIIGQWGAIG